MVVFNPQSGSGRRTQELRALVSSRPGLVLRETDNGDEATRLVREAVGSGCTRVIAAGGDGTLHAVVNGLAEGMGRASLGVLPIGSANDFAQTLQLPADLDEAMRVIDAGHEVPVDVVQARTAGGGPRYWLNAATGGFSVEMSRQLDPGTKARFGAWAYVVAGLKAAPQMPRYRVRLVLDGRPLQAEVIAVVVANGRRAGGLELVPDADPSDGLMDVLLITAEGLAEQAQLLAEFAINRHLDSDLLVHARGRWMELESDPPLALRIDGEPLAPGAVRFQVLPHALRLLAPAA